MDAFTRSFLLLFVLLNPFILSIHLIELVRGLDASAYRHHIVRACLISTAVFWVFAAIGDGIFGNLMLVSFGPDGGRRRDCRAVVISTSLNDHARFWNP